MNIPEGYKLVPVEPTKDMLFACEEAGSITNHLRGARIYRSMLAAAPDPDTHIAAPEESAGVDFGIDGRSVRVSQETYSIFLAPEEAGREKIAALQKRLTAADERVDVLEGLLREVEAACDLAMSAIDHDERGENFVRIIAAIKAKAVPKRSDELVAQHAAIDFFDAALKPAEVRCNIPACDYQIDMDQN